jgi:DNA repair exonuclease SbcCD ATPase subunit
MSRLFPNQDVQRNGSKPAGRAAPAPNVAAEESLAGQAEPSDPNLHPDTEAGLGEEGPPDPERLLFENIQLRELVAELEKHLEEMRLQAEQAQKEYEGLLEEKSEVIRSLHRKLQEQQERPAAPSGPVPREQELLALSEELEQERRQLKEDEEALMAQMREMEVTMSRERAELARQRNELLRLQTELRHELEMAGRDAALRERLAPLQRRSQELANRRGSGPPPSEAAASPSAPAAPSAEQARPRKDSGLFSRLFGQR